MSVETPTINKIIRMTEYDLLRTNINKFDMYMCLDSQKLYYDETDSTRVIYNYLGVKTANDLVYNITPEFGRSYYCWEDNTLWYWANKWVCVYSDSKYPSAYVYSNWNAGTGDLSSVYRYDEPFLPADDNGLLHDGSVIVRDPQRIIKGRLYIDEGNDNFVISSFLGGGIKLLPNGAVNTEGELYISDENNSFIRSQWTVKNGEMYVNYAEDPINDPANGTILERPDHNYKVFHEGNLDASLIQALTGQMVYNALITDANSLPNPFDFNVKKLDGKTISEISLVGHHHLAADIDDFNNAAQTQATTVFNTLFSHNLGTEGITITSPTTGNYVLSANDFNLTFTGGATGTGSVSHLSNTSIALTVDPTKHTHQDLINSIDGIQQQVNNISTIDPNNYYTKTQTDTLIDAVTPTNVPTQGKALTVNSSGILPVNTLKSYSLVDNKTISLTGDITGSVTTDFSTNTVNINTSALNILSSSPTQGKALAVDANGNLPGNASTASSLNHTIALSLTGEATGTGTIDTSINTASIQVTLVPGNNILQTSDLDVTIPTLDSNGKIQTTQIPSSLLATTLKLQGTFNPANGVPSNNPMEGYFWISTGYGIIGSLVLEEFDLLTYLNGVWQVITANKRVTSINGRTGRVQLDYTDVDGISTSYINYTLGTTVPANKIPLTDSAGHLPGVKVDALTNSFSIGTTNGDVEINTTTSTNVSTDGTSNLNVQLDLTQTGYQNILDNVGYVLQSNNTDLTHKKKLNFDNSLTIETNTNDYTVKINEYLNRFNWLYVDDNNTGLITNNTQAEQDILDNVNTCYATRSTKPTILVRALSTNYNTEDNNFELYMLNSKLPNITTGPINISVTQLNPRVIEHNSNETNYVQYINKLKVMTLKFDVNNDLTEIEWSSNSSNNPVIDLLPISSATAQTTAYTPVYDAQPANKKYVDDNMVKIFTWDGQSSSQNADNIQLWQDIYDASANSDVIVLMNKKTGTQFNTTPIRVSVVSSNSFFRNNIYSSIHSIYFSWYGYNGTTSSTTTDGTLLQAEIYSASISVSNNVVTSVSNSIHRQSTSPRVLSTDNSYASSVTFTPTLDGHPATKKYVDDSISSQKYKTTIGDGTSTSYTITHNLGTADLIIQFRDNNTLKQIDLENTVIDNNSISVTSTTPLSVDEVTVTIIKI